MVVVAGRGELAARWLAMEFGVIAVVGWGVEDGWEEGVGRCLVVDGVGVAILAVKDTLGTSCRLREVHCCHFPVYTRTHKYKSVNNDD